MKILYIADRINKPDGYAVHCRSFVEHVKALGHEIITYPPIRPIDYTFDNRKPVINKNIVYYLKKFNIRTLKKILHRSNGYISEIMSFVEGLADTFAMKKKIVAIIDRHGIDAIIYRHRLFNFAPFMASSDKGVPIVCEVNSMRSMEQKLISANGKVTALTIWAERRSLAAADAICVVSSSIKEKIESYKIGVPVTVVPNGVDTDIFNPESHPKDQAKKALGLSNKIVLGYVGSYKNWHGLDISLETLKILCDKDPRWHLLLIGKGPCYESISRDIQAKGLQKSVTQIENVPHHQIPEFMAAFDIALMTYPHLPDFYFSPLKMFEYMAMAIPVVATNIGQIAEIISDETGALVYPPSPEEFSRAILETEKIGDLGVKARKLMKESYSWRQNAQEIIESCRFLCMAHRKADIPGNATLR